jgi:restriction system protein
MEVIDFSEIAKLVPHISTTRKYWLVRTQGGLYYDDFKDRNFIAVGYNSIRLEDIVDAKKRVEKYPENYLASVIKGRITDEKKPKYAAQQLLKFAYGIKAGDIVIIPSANSRTISIGEIVSNDVYLYIDAPKSVSAKGDSKKCPFIKRKAVKWVKEVRRSELDPLLYKLLFSHHFISDGSAYDNIIDNMLHDFYVKGSQTYLVLDVETQKRISAKSLFDTGSSLLSWYSDNSCGDATFKRIFSVIPTTGGI